MQLVTGFRLSSYEIIAPLGAGGMGEVYRARDAALKRDVAIKVLPPNWSGILSVCTDSNSRRSLLLP